MLVFVLWVSLSIIIGIIGYKREIGALGAYFVSLLFSPLVGAIVIAASSPRKR